jgi:hypothetical protein
MKKTQPTFLIVFSLLITILHACTGENIPSATGYYESTPAPQFIAEHLGPFGPREKSYTPPDGAVFVAPDGRDSNSGTTPDSPITLPGAISEAGTGSVIVLRGGVYRTGDLEFNKKITLQPYLDERPVLKGSEIAEDWIKRGEYWVTEWDHMFYNDPPRWYKPGGRDGPACNYNDDLVIFDGRMFRPVESPSELDSGRFYCDYEAGEIYISEDPSGKTVEISEHKYGLVRRHDETADVEGPAILGLDVLHFAGSCIVIEGDDPYRFIEPGEMPDAPVRTHIENCRLLFCSRTGLRIISPESYIGYNDISMMGNGAVTPRMSHNGVFEHNKVSHSNWYNLRIYPAGIKVFNQSYNYTVRNNYFAEMPCEAVWYDVGHREGVIVNNYFYNCGVGIKIEICHRTYIAGNVFNKSNLWLCNSNGCLAYNNTLIDSRIDLWRNNRGRGGTYNKNYSFNHASTGPGPLGYHGHQVANNVFAGPEPRGGYYLLIEDNNNHGPEILDQNFQSEVLAHNLFLNEAEWTINAEFQPKGLQPVNYESLADFREVYGEYEEGNIQLDLTGDELFRARSQGDYSLNDLPGIPDGIDLPESVATLLGWNSSRPGLGAFAGTE